MEIGITVFELSIVLQTKKKSYVPTVEPNLGMKYEVGA